MSLAGQPCTYYFCTLPAPWACMAQIPNPSGETLFLLALAWLV